MSVFYVRPRTISPLAVQDVRRSIAPIKANPFIPHKERVRGFVYDVATGRLREVPAAS